MGLIKYSVLNQIIKSEKFYSTKLSFLLFDLYNLNLKKSRKRETKHLSADADSSTNAIRGWTKNTQKPDFFEKRKKSPKTQKLRNV